MSAALNRMTLEEFLAWDDQQPEKLEFDGFGPVVPQSMVGSTEAHSIIRMNLATALVTRLRGSRCRAHDDSLRVHAAGKIRYPDAFVSCGPRDLKATVARDPIVIFEVLSPSIAVLDETIKNAEYRDTPSIQRYVMLSQDRPMATVFHRQGPDWIGALVTDLAATLELPEIGIALPMTELYDGVFDA